MKTLIPAVVLAATTLLAPLAAQAQTTQTYAGNGATGFGGNLGNGALTVSDNGTGSVTFTLAPHNGLGNAAVVYIDSQTGGFTDTSSFTDNGDGGREAIAGFNANNPSRTLASFSPGFAADYAIAFEDNFVGLFALAPVGNNAFNFITGSPTNATPYTLTVSAAQLGITGGGDRFNFVGSLISQTAYRSNETLGTSVTTPGSAGDAPNAGFNGTTTFSSFDTFAGTPAAAPEPAPFAVLGMIGVGLGALLLTARRRAASAAQ